MLEPNLKLILFFSFVGLFTIAASVFDFRFRKIPNKLTIPMFLLGLIFKVSFNGWSGSGETGFLHAGLSDALLAFSVGFGTLFLLWMIGGGGGGDVKLMGALSVWLGFQLTLYVMIISTVFVLIGTSLVVFTSVLTRGIWKTKNKYVANSEKENKKKKAPKETVGDRKQRRIMAYAIPIALATWAVLIWQTTQPIIH
ncbi:hypothetical protein MNBD_PLANCTO02-2096 [hydrothermal vent metagenome]|uniref:Prepilin type IV endopeptidase peptidase domain-containing protein n=1 Tax=hydrothermal vent metagenome TaxID=652676 RepID=A0A3B1DFL2_9ZZZZ